MLNLNKRSLNLKSAFWNLRLHVKNLRRCSSTFKPPYQRSTCRLEKVFKAASRVKSLKPHCVSLIPLTQKNHTRKWNPYIRNVRNRDRCHKKNENAKVLTIFSVMLQYLDILRNIVTWATDSFSRWALDPQEITMLFCMDTWEKDFQRSLGKERSVGNLITVSPG